MNLYETGYAPGHRYVEVEIGHDIGDRYIKVEIEYEVCGGYWEYPHPCTPAVRFWVPADIYIESVRVLSVEYFTTDGVFITRVIRKNVGPEALAALDAEALEYANEVVEAGDGFIYDLLMENC